MRNENINPVLGVLGKIGLNCFSSTFPHLTSVGEGNIKSAWKIYCGDNSGKDLQQLKKTFSEEATGYIEMIDPSGDNYNINEIKQVLESLDT